MKEEAAKAECVLLATDPDREGEAISWHVAELLGMNKEDNIRIEFNEISEKAIKRRLLALAPSTKISLTHNRQGECLTDWWVTRFRPFFAKNSK